MPFGGWDGQQGSLDIRRAEEPAKKKTFGAGWADGLAEFRDDMREKETSRNQRRALVKEEEADSFIQNIKEAYYKSMNLTQEQLDSAIFVTKPGEGASILQIS